MTIEAVLKTYRSGLSELEKMVKATEDEVLKTDGNISIITKNINFFTKSFLISTCAHLEMCVKEIVFIMASEIDARISAATIPISIIEWRYATKRKTEQEPEKPKHLLINMTRKEIDDLVSGNVYRTKEALALVGIDLTKDKPAWDSWKETIQAIITRRNNIVHHNDDASDLSLGDIRANIASVHGYIDFIALHCK